jgi:hypothetical protein
MPDYESGDLKVQVLPTRLGCGVTGNTAVSETADCRIVPCRPNLEASMSSNAAYMREYMKRRYWERRDHALRVLGNKCSKCPATDQLEVDHIDPTTKTMSFEHMRSVSMKRFLVLFNTAAWQCMENTAVVATIVENSTISGTKNIVNVQHNFGV